MERVIRSFGFAAKGLWHAINSQTNFQIQVVVGTIVVVWAFFLEFSRFEWLILIITVAFVLTGELVNTVFEVVVDLAVKEKLIPEAKLAKDVAAATVLLISIFAVFIGLVLFIPHLW